MNHKYLEQTKYDWLKDKRRLRVEGIIPDNRCCHCGRVFLNAKFGIFFCRECDIAMSAAKEGPEHDYDSFAESKKLLADRLTREPLDFDFEEKMSKASKTNFMTAGGKPLPVEDEDPDERIKRLYDLR